MNYRVNAACILFDRHGKAVARGGDVLDLTDEEHAAYVVSGQKHKLSPAGSSETSTKPRRKKRASKKAASEEIG